MRLFHTYALFPLFAFLCIFTEKYLVPGTWSHILTTCFYGVPQKADLYCELLKGDIGTLQILIPRIVTVSLPHQQ